MKKRIVSFLLAAVLCLSLAPMALAAESINNFTKVASYASGQFVDVPESQWYAQNVKTVYELGLVKGIDKSHFNPTGNISIAETITLAARLHSIYMADGADFTQGSVWYQVYVDYAIENGIITSWMFTDYDRQATRAEFAVVMAKALPDSALSQINNIPSGKIPDIDPAAVGSDAIYKLYRAGILTGNDEYGTFDPFSTIQRCEVAAIVTRLAVQAERKSVSLKDKPIPVSKVTIAESYSTLSVGCSFSFKAECYPANATNRTVVWSSSNTSVLTVDSSGTVTGVKPGSAVVTASCGGKSAAITVTVIEKQRLTKDDISIRLIIPAPGEKNINVSVVIVNNSAYPIETPAAMFVHGAGLHIFKRSAGGVTLAPGERKTLTFTNYVNIPVTLYSSSEGTIILTFCGQHYTVEFNNDRIFDIYEGDPS